MSTLRSHWPLTLFIAFCALVLSGLFPENSSGQHLNSDQAKIEALMNRFNRRYNELGIPGLTLSYEDNLSNIGQSQELNNQLEFFNSIRNALNEISEEKLPSHLQLEYTIIDYEITLNIERIKLSRAFIKSSSSIDDKGIYHQTNGKNWYLYFIKKWTSDILTPEEITDYGRAEVKRIKEEMVSIKRTSGLSNFNKFISSDHFSLYDQKEVERLFAATKDRVDRNLFSIFPDFENLPALKIAQGQNIQLAQTPGYYSNNTFYYNLFDQPFDKKQADWLFLHEGNPGHHFQLNYESTIEIPTYRENLSYGGFREGWAAYVEDIGKDLGLYRTAFDYYGKLEWDLIRSTRLILDVGINYYGWTDKTAMEEWKKHISHADKIGKREIARMRRWPAQILTYKLGSKRIKECLSNRKEKLRSDFNLKEFHTSLLSQRSVPVLLMDKLFL